MNENAGTPNADDLSHLGFNQRMRYEHTHALNDLEAAINAWQQAVDVTPWNAPDRAIHLYNLGIGLYDRYMRSGMLKDLEEAILLWRRAIRLVPARSLQPSAILVNLGAGLYKRYMVSRMQEDLDGAIDAYQRALDSDVALYCSPNRAMYFTNLSVALRSRYMQSGKHKDLEDAFSASQRAIELVSADSPYRAMILSNLGAVLRDRYELDKESGDLENAINVYQQAIDLVPTESIDRAMLLYNLSISLHDRHGRTEDLENAIRACKQILKLLPSGSPERAMQFHHLGKNLHRLYLHIGNPAELDSAIEALREAVNLLPASFPEKIEIFLNELSVCLHDRYARNQTLEDLERAILLAQKAIELVPAGTPDHAVYLSNLGTYLRDRYARSGTLEDLESAIFHCRQAAKVMPTDSPSWATSLCSLSICLRDRYERNGLPEDLEESIALCRQAIELVLETSPNRAAHLDNLGHGLRMRYARTGASEDLENAVLVCRQAVAHTRAGSPSLANHLSSLGFSLRNRYRHSGALVDLDDAISAWRKALDVAPADWTAATILNNLGAGLTDRYAHTEALEDLENAIDAWQRAVNLTPANSPSLPARLSNLGAGLLRRCDQHGGAREDLDRAITVSQRAVDLIPPDSPERVVYIGNAGSCLLHRHKQGGVPQDLDDAIIAFKYAVDRTPVSSPSRIHLLGKLADGLDYRYEHRKNVADLQASIDAYEEAARTGFGVALEDSLRIAGRWLRLAFSRASWTETIRAFSYADEAGRQLVKTQLLRQSKEAWLMESRGLAEQAAYAMAKLDKPVDAAVTLDRSRAQLLDEVLLRSRISLEQLQTLGHPDLYARYRDANDKWEAAARLEHQHAGGQLAVDHVDALKAARNELEAVIADIREIPGYETFLRPSDFSDIRTAAAWGPLVYIVATQAGGLALLVSGENLPTVSIIWLPTLTIMALAERCVGPGPEPEGGGYLVAYNAWRSAPGNGAVQSAWLTALDEATSWLWTAVVEPVLNALPPGDKVTLIPCGLLGLLPLHAAWTEDQTQPTQRRYALDQRTFSYSPNARALNSARAISTRTSSNTLLAVNEPSPVNAPALPNAAFEVQMAASTFANSQILEHEHATREALLQALPQYDVVHFACHGYASLAKPLNSGLKMAQDHLLTPRTLLMQRLPGARLAVLSACETGLSGGKLLDEVMGLPTGLLQAGFAGVIASLWSVADLSTAMLMIRFYTLWRHDKLEPSDALCQAQKWLRDTTNGQKERYFRTVLTKFAADSTLPKVMPIHVAEALWQQLFLHAPGERDYQHPFHWAAFQYTGV